LLDGTGAVSYQWQGGDAPAGPFTDIASAAADTYTLAAADDGKYIVVTVTRVDNSGSVTSSPTLVPASHPIAAWIADTIAAAVALDSGAGSDADHTISLPPPNINLSASGSYGWAGILAALASAGRYVELDLSACTMSSGTTFDPGAADTGERYITALIFPDTATIIAGSSNINAPTFRYFTALKSVSGAGIQTVGNFAFRSCTSLETMSFLTATHIDQHAFASCTALSTVELPEATHIGWNALAYGIFSTLSLPAVIDIQGYAFASCRALTTLNLPAVPPTLGGSAFISTSTGPMLTIQVPSGTVADYESDWGVLADTAVSGNEGRYGQFHKRIVITDTP
jgi:hypothetical protein